MKYLKRYLGSILCLVLIDQLVKVIIYFFYFDYERDIIGNIVRFRPIQNTSLSWAGNFINIFSNMSIVVSINILVMGNNDNIINPIELSAIELKSVNIKNNIIIKPILDSITGIFTDFEIESFSYISFFFLSKYSIIFWQSI